MIPTDYPSFLHNNKAQGEIEERNEAYCNTVNEHRIFSTQQFNLSRSRVDGSAGKQASAVQGGRR